MTADTPSRRTRPSSRRDILAHAAGMAAVAGAALATRPASAASPADAELIELCGRFDALERGIGALHSSGSAPITDDDERAAAAAPMEARQDALLGRLCAMRAVTLAGLAARADTLALWADLDRAESCEGDCWDDRMLAALLRDLRGMAA